MKSSKSELENVYKLLDKAENDLKESSKIISVLNNQKLLIGGGVGLMTDFSSKILYGAKLNAGYKLWLGFISGELAVFNDKSFTFGITYNMVL